MTSPTPALADPEKLTKRCEYCGTMLNDNGEEESNVAAAGPMITHFDSVCRERVHAALRATRRDVASQAAEIAELRGRATLLDGILTSLYEEMGYEGSGGPLSHLQSLMGKTVAAEACILAREHTIVVLQEKLAAAEAERDGCKNRLRAIFDCVHKWANSPKPDAFDELKSILILSTDPTP